MSITTETTKTVPAMGDNSANASNQLVLSAGTALDRFGSAYRAAERDQSTAWQSAIAICYKMCEIGGLLPAYEVDGKTPNTGPANLSLAQLRSPEGSGNKSAIHNGLAYFIAHYLDCDLAIARVMVKFLANLVRRGYTLADWNGQIQMDGETIVDVALSPVLPGMRNEETPGCWRLRLVDVASSAEGSLAFLPDTAEWPITICEMTKASTGAIVWKDTDQTRICLASDRAYSFRYGPDLGKGIRNVAKNVRVGRTTFNTVAKALLEAEAQAIADAAAETQKQIADAAAAAALAKGEGEVQEQGNTDTGTDTDQTQSQENAGTDKPDTDKPEGDKSEGSPVGDETKDKPKDTDKPDNKDGAKDKPKDKDTDTNKDNESEGDDKSGDDDDDDDTASERETSNQMRVNDDRTREEKDKLANGITPQKLSEMFGEVMTPGRLNESAEARVAFTRVFIHCVGVLRTLKAPTADALLKMAVAKTVNEEAGKAFIRDDSRRNAS